MEVAPIIAALVGGSPAALPSGKRAGGKRRGKKT